ncbi:FtsX-like permease family protein [Actinacidiphila glaucinigra]|uniref:FtsX-like permease family protein n=1 Tax=Actinacidiphila glaucinigra TaxID=235986 RepID=UPI0036E7901E
MSKSHVPRGGDVSLIRSRLRAAPGTALAMAVLVLGTAFVTAVLPRAVEAYENAALLQRLSQASVAGRSVSASFDVHGGETDLVSAASLESDEEGLRSVFRPPLSSVLRTRDTVSGVRSLEPLDAGDRALPRPTGTVDPQSTVVAQFDLPRHARLVDGRFSRRLSDPRRVEAVVTDRTAGTMGLRAGSELHLRSSYGSELTVGITGIIRPDLPEGPYWKAERDLRAPTLNSRAGPRGGGPEEYWHFTVLIAPEDAWRMTAYGDGVRVYFHHPADPERTKVRDVPALRDQLDSLITGPGAAELRDSRPHMGEIAEDGLSALLGSFDEERVAARPLVLVATVGVAAVAGIVLLMAAGLQADRRRSEFTLLRARGISLPALAGRLLAESALPAIPGAAAGVVLALAAVPSETHVLPVLLGSLVGVFATVSLPLRAVAVSARPVPDRRADLTAARPSRRRDVAELTVTVIVIGSVVALRRRGTADGGADVLTAAAPVLVAVAAALVLLRLYPWPLRLLARPFARLDGAVLHLGLARAGRAPSMSALPLMALLVALAVTSFGGSVLAGVEGGRDRAALRVVGADARVDSSTGLPAALESRVRGLHGVRDTSAVRIEKGLSTPSGVRYSLVIADPAPYGRVVSSTGTGAPFPSLAGDGREPMPAVVSPGLARAFERDVLIVRSSAGRTPVRAVATRDVTPALGTGEFVVVSATDMARRHARAARELPASTTLLVTGSDLRGAQLRAVVRQVSQHGQVTLRSEERASYGTSALQSGARHVYLAAVAAGAGYSVLALLLSLLHNAPQRKALLARLRTMGMTGHQRQWLAVLEMLPQVLLGALGGILVSVATVPLVRPGVDLVALAFTVRTPATDLSGAVLRTDAASLLVPATALVVLACVVLAVQAWLTGRRGEGTELRMGERS